MFCLPREAEDTHSVPKRHSLYPEEAFRSSLLASLVVNTQTSRAAVDKCPGPFMTSAETMLFPALSVLLAPLRSMKLVRVLQYSALGWAECTMAGYLAAICSCEV